MFFLIFLFVASLVVSLFLTPKPKLPNATPGKLSDVNFPRATEGAPIPRIYGTLKFKAPNTIWQGDFESRPIKKRVATGLFSHKNQTIGYRYFLGLDLAICMGPKFTFRRIWAGNYELWNGCLASDACENVITINLPKLFGGDDKQGGFTGDIALYCGNYDQSQDPYLQSKIFPTNANQVPAYNGTAHMVFRHCNFGNTTSIQPIYVEGSCFPDSLDLAQFLIMPNGLDMNPVGILHHIYADDWGSLGVDASKINEDQWRSVAETIFNEANGMSLEVTNPSQASDAVKEILSQINATTYQNPSTGEYDLILIRDDYIFDDLPILGPSQIKSITNFTKVLWSETFNTVRIKFIDRNQDYKDGVVAMQQDFALVRFQKKVRAQEIPMQGCYEPVLANTLAARELSNLNVPLYSGELQLNRIGSALPPGKVFRLQWPEYNIVDMVVRVRKLGLGTLQDGTVSMSFVQDVFSIAATVMAPPVVSPYTPPDTSAQPIVAPIIYDLPYWLDDNAGIHSIAGTQSVGVFAKAPGPYSIGFNGYVVGTPTDAEVLTTEQYSKTASLVSAIDIYDGFVAGMLPTLIIENVTDPAVLTNGDALSGNGLFMIDSELFAFDTFVDNGDGTFTLTNVYRALMDTVYSAHAAASVIYIFNGQDGFITGSFTIGTAFDLKLADVTSSSEYATPAALPHTPVTRAGAPLPPDGLAIDGTRATTTTGDAGGSVSLSWLYRSRVAAPAVLAPESAAADAPEAGTLYKVEAVLPDASVVLIADDVVASPLVVNLTEAMAGDTTLRVWSKFGTTLSYTPAIYPVHVLGYITIDADRITIDGNGILI